MVHLVLQPLVMTRESMESPCCPDEEQGADALPAPRSLGSRLEIELEPKVQTPPISESHISHFQRGRRGCCFHRCPPAVSVSRSNISGGSPTTQRMKYELPSMGCENLHGWLQTSLPASSVSSLHCHPYVTVKSDPLLRQHTPFLS